MLITVTTGATSLRSLLETGGANVSNYSARVRDVLIQNKHASESIYIEFDGITPTTAASLEIAAGDSFSYTGVILGDTNLIAGASNNAVRILINK